MAELKKVEQPEETGQKQEMKLGEYFLHVYVEESTQLNIANEKAENIAIKITALGESKYTKVREDITADTDVFYGDHFFFIKIFDDRELLESESLEITVLSKGTLSLNKEIGSVSLNLSAIYFEQNHTLRHKWFVLQNKNQDFQQAQGYLKLSVNLSADSDERAELTPEAVITSGDAPKIEIPPSIQLSFSQLKITIIRAVNLPKVDMLGAGINAYVQATYSGVSMRTKVDSSMTPYWNQEILMQVVSPSYASILKLQLFDRNALTSNELIGTIDVDMKQIKRGKFKELYWMHLYGATKEANSKVRNLMAQLPSKGNRKFTKPRITEEV